MLYYQNPRGGGIYVPATYDDKLMNKSPKNQNEDQDEG